MTERFAIYYAPARDSAFAERAEAWFGRPELKALTVSARKYGFHATLKAPMALKPGLGRAQLETAVAAYARTHPGVELGRLEVRLIDGFVALVPAVQARHVTDFAAEIVTAFEGLRQKLDAGERTRRLRAPLSDRQIQLLDKYGYPYVLEQFQFHMTLTDRLNAEQREQWAPAARAWFAAELALPVRLDRLVLFYEPEPGAAFRRLDDYVLGS